MKFLWIIVTSFFILSANASIFDGKFPASFDYQAMLFSDSKIYLTELFKRSVVTRIENGYVMRFIESGNEMIIHGMIDRKLKNIGDENELTETVIYELNGNIVTFSLVKLEKMPSNTPDLDLLTMDFAALDIKNHNYELIFKDIGLYIKHQWTETSDMTFFIFHQMELSFKIETINSLFPIRRYSFFFKEMPNPQTELVIEAIPILDGLYNFKFAARGEEQIGPKEFYTGMKGLEDVIAANGNIIRNIFYNNDFPIFMP